MPLPFWRRGSGRRDLLHLVRLALLLGLELVAIVVLLIVVGSIVIPWAAPSLDAPPPPPTSVPAS